MQEQSPNQKWLGFFLLGRMIVCLDDGLFQTNNSQWQDVLTKLMF